MDLLFRWTFAVVKDLTRLLKCHNVVFVIVIWAKNGSHSWGYGGMLCGFWVHLLHNSPRCFIIVMGSWWGRGERGRLGMGKIVFCCWMIWGPIWSKITKKQQKMANFTLLLWFQTKPNQFQAHECMKCLIGGGRRTAHRRECWEEVLLLFSRGVDYLKSIDQRHYTYTLLIRLASSTIVVRNRGRQ